jgi:hypothetical protein
MLTILSWRLLLLYDIGNTRGYSQGAYVELDLSRGIAAIGTIAHYWDSPICGHMPFIGYKGSEVDDEGRLISHGGNVSLM